MDRLYIDIETIPSQQKWVADEVEKTVKPPATIKKDESKQKWYEENYAAAFGDKMGKCSFDGAMSHIITIGYAVNDGEAVVFHADHEAKEREILEGFIVATNNVKYPTIIGHNVTGFDMRMIRQRCLVLGIPLSKNMPWDAKPWDKNPYDTMMQWDGKNFISQDRLAKAFGIKGKGDVDGSMVYPMWKAGKHKEIAQYCKDDVETVRKIYKHMIGEK